MAANRCLRSSMARLGTLAIGLALGACGGGSAPSVLPSAPSANLVAVKTELGTLTVDASRCGDIDIEQVALHFNRDLDKPCQQKMGIRSLDASKLLLECARSWQYVGQYFPPQHIVFAREQALRHERDHWAARELGLPCWAEVDHSVDFCCQPL